MSEPTLRNVDTTEERIPFEQRQELDKLISKIQEARKAVKQYYNKDSKLDEKTLNYLKSINNQLNYFKRDLSNYLNPQTKQNKIISQTNTGKQTKLI
jgi:argonaute-like protein implicated in RNA metabolism and viral defense